MNGRAAATLLLFGVTACSSSHRDALPHTSFQQHATMSIQLKIPYPPAKHAQYISPATQSVAIEPLGATYIYANVTPTSPGCTATATGTVCRFDNIGALAGQTSIEVDAYDKPLTSGGSWQGNLLSSGTTTVTIVAGQANVVDIAMGGVPAKAKITSLNSTPLNGAPTDLHFALDVMDADGYTIVGSERYSMGLNYNPVSVSLQQAAPIDAAYRLTYTVNGASVPSYDLGMSLSAPSDTYSIAYKGRGLISGTLQVQANGTPILASATIKPQPAIVTAVQGGPQIPADAAIAMLGSTIWFTEPAKKSIAYYDGTLHEIPLKNGHTPTQLTYAANFMYGQSLAYGTQEGTVGLINPQYLSEMPLNTASPVGGLGFDEVNLVFLYTQPAAGKVGTMSLSGYNLEYTLPSGAAPGFMNAGYFVDPGRNSIGYVNTSGWKEYPLPTPGSKPSWVGDGGPGAVWIAEAGAKRVAVMDTQSGAMLEYSTTDVLTSIARSLDTEVATDAAGNIEYFDGAGKVSAFPTGSAGPATRIRADFHDAASTYFCPTCAAGIQDFLL